MHHKPQEHQKFSRRCEMKLFRRMLSFAGAVPTTRRVFLGLAMALSAMSMIVIGLLSTPAYAAGSPALISIVSGGSQTATVGGVYPYPLEVQVLDSKLNPVPGVAVVFSASGINQGAAASFTGGGSTTSEVTGSNGEATSPTLFANDTSGAFTATATVAGLPPVYFYLDNLVGTPSNVVAGLGSSQSTADGTAFAVPLAVTVTDSDNNPVPDIVVTFSAPSAGASGVFSTTGTHYASVTTDSKGIAVAPTFSANDVSGGYIVTANVSGDPYPASFSMVNIASVSQPSAASNKGKGYWEVASDGGIFSFGDAGFYGSMGGKALSKPIVGIAVS